MAIKVQIPAPLRSLTGGADQVEVEAGVESADESKGDDGEDADDLHDDGQGWGGCLGGPGHRGPRRSPSSRWL